MVLSTKASVVFLVLAVVAAESTEEKGVSDVLKSIPQGVQCLPYQLPGIGGTICYKFASSVELGDDAISQGLDNAAKWLTVKTCTQQWSGDTLKNVMCRRHTGKSWYHKMHFLSTNAGHVSCTMEEAETFVDEMCKGRERPATEPSLSELLEVAAQTKNRVTVHRGTLEDRAEMFGRGHPFTAKEGMLHMFKAANIPTSLTIQIGVKKADKKGKLGKFESLYTLVDIGSNPGKPWCVNMLEMIQAMSAMGGTPIPIDYMMSMLTKFTAGYWDGKKGEAFIKSIGKYCIAWDASFDGDIAKLTFNEGSLGLAHSAKFDLPSFYGLLGKGIKYHMKQSPLFKMTIRKDPMSKVGVRIMWDTLTLTHLIPPQITKIKRMIVDRMKGNKAVGPLNPVQVLGHNSLCAAMWTSSHCDKCSEIVYPMVVKQLGLFAENPEMLDWKMLINKKGTEDLTKNGAIDESEGYEMCMVASKDRSACHCNRGITQEGEVDLCNGDLSRMFLKTNEKNMPMDETEVGKIFKELVSTPLKKDQPLYLSVMARIGELQRMEAFRKQKAKLRISQQICYETKCGCTSHLPSTPKLKGQGYFSRL